MIMQYVKSSVGALMSIRADTFKFVFTESFRKYYVRLMSVR